MSQKTIAEEVARFFPFTRSAQDIQFFVYERERLIEKIDELLTGERKETEFEKLIAGLIRVRTFDDPRGFEVDYDISFEKTCILLAQHTNKDVKKLSVKEYFTLVDFVKQKAKK